LIKLNENGLFDRPNLVLGNKFLIFGPQNETITNVSGTINSIFVVVTGGKIKYDFDLLLFNGDLSSNSVVENNKDLILAEADVLKCIGKIRVENNGNMADDYLNPVGGHYFANLFNLHIPFSVKHLFGVAVYQEGSNKYNLNGNTHLIINCEKLSQRS